MIGFDDCVVRVPEIGWRVASLAAERAEAVRLSAALRDAIFELEFSGMAYDHPKLVSLRAALSPTQQGN